MLINLNQYDAHKHDNYEQYCHPAHHVHHDHYGNHHDYIVRGNVHYALFPRSPVYNIYLHIQYGVTGKRNDNRSIDQVFAEACCTRDTIKALLWIIIHM